ncbi:MAG TPA: glycosyltransferase family 2 protein [Candidatus Kryptobacter bacterium]|nr:glycosyltransferase family 2 protein [Candidatus Kryptobacter bacterium]
MLLSIILVNYKQAEQTIECVRSLEKSSFHDFRTIIVDNESTPESASKLRSYCPNAVVLPCGSNLGFAGGNNVGIRYAVESGSDFILLLNNDTIVHENLLATLVDTIQSRETIGVVGAKIYYEDRRDLLWFAGGHLSIDKALATHRGIQKEDNGAFDTLQETDFVTGCCLMTKREVIEHIGMLDTGFFLYYEDSDFCTRAKDAGYSVIYQPKAVLYHKVSYSTELDSPVYIYFNLRNKILFLRKHGSPARWIRHLPYFFYFYGRQFIRLIIKRHNLRGARAAYLGLVDGLRSFTGEHGEGNLMRL